MGKNAVYWPKTPDFCPQKWQNSKLNSIGPGPVFCNRYWRKTLSFRSDSNSYFPVGPCEYGGPLQALMAGDANAGTSSGITSWSKIWINPRPVFLLDEPEKIPRHNLYELVWFLKTGATRSPTWSPPSSSWLLSTRMKRMMLGLEPFVYDFGILTEGYQHYTPWVLWGGGGELQSANGHTSYLLRTPRIYSCKFFWPV